MELDDLSDQESARHSYHMASFLFGKSGLPNEVEEQVMRDPAYYPTLIRYYQVIKGSSCGRLLMEEN